MGPGQREPVLVFRFLEECVCVWCACMSVCVCVCVCEREIFPGYGGLASVRGSFVIIYSLQTEEDVAPRLLLWTLCSFTRHFRGITFILTR